MKMNHTPQPACLVWPGSRIDVMAKALILISWRQKESYFIEGLRRWVPSISTEASKSKKKGHSTDMSIQWETVPTTHSDCWACCIWWSQCVPSQENKIKYSIQESLTSGTWPTASISAFHPHQPSSPPDGFHLRWLRPHNNSNRVFLLQNKLWIWHARP